MANYFDSFTPAYVLKRAANGYMLRTYPSEWSLFAVLGTSVKLVETSGVRPSYVEAEKKIKAAN